MKRRRSSHLNAWNVYIKRRSIEIFNKENDFSDINEFKEYINLYKPFDKKRQHKKKTIKNENAYYRDPDTEEKRKVETFEHFRLMALQDWNSMTEDDKAVYRSIALDMNKQSKGEIVDDCSLNQRCKKEVVVDRHQVDRRFKSDLLVLQYQAQQLQKGIDAMISKQ